MQIGVGNILEGKVTGITKFGAFVDIGEGKTGMVHISEVAINFVNDINEHLELNQSVKVKVININEQDKISLSIKQAMPNDNQNRSSYDGEKKPAGSGFRDRKSSGGDFQNKKSGTGYQKRSDQGGYSNNRKPRNFQHQPSKPGPTAKNIDSFEWGARKSDAIGGSFEDMMSKFKQSSDDKMSDIKKGVDVKRGSSNRKNISK